MPGLCPGLRHLPRHRILQNQSCSCAQHLCGCLFDTNTIKVPKLSAKLLQQGCTFSIDDTVVYLNKQLENMLLYRNFCTNVRGPWDLVVDDGSHVPEHMNLSNKITEQLKQAQPTLNSFSERSCAQSSLAIRTSSACNYNLNAKLLKPSVNSQRVGL